MSETLIPSQSSALTSTQNGTNIRADLRPESQFYVDTAVAIGNPTSFGKISSIEFSTTSVISFSGVCKVYAICKGQVFLQPMSGAGNEGKVNLILRPFKQPINGLAIKYFIYRGLKKSDFFADGKLLATNQTESKLVEKVNTEFDNFYKNKQANEKPIFLSNFLGYRELTDTAQNENDLLDEYFFKISDTETDKVAFELPMVERGTLLGSAESSLGIDVVLNEGDFFMQDDPNPFQLNLKFARAKEHKLSTGNYTPYRKKLVRESASMFMDIAAFYGLHTQGKGKIYINASTEPLTTTANIYSLIEKYQTKNTTYLYIQSNRQRSYDFYGNYHLEDTTNIKVGTDVSNLTKETFGVKEDWAVKAFNGANQITLQLTTDNYTDAAVYVKTGILNVNTIHEDYYLRNDNILQKPSTDPNVTVDINYTKPITFDVIKTGAENSPICNFIQLICETKKLLIQTEEPNAADPNTTETVNYYLKDIDDVFGMIDESPVIQNKQDRELHYVVDQNLLLVNFNNATGGKDIATVTSKRTEDVIQKSEDETLSRITYETLLHNIRQSNNTFTESLSAYSDNTNSGTIHYDKNKNNFYQPETPYYLKTQVFTDSQSGNTVTGLTLEVQTGGLPSKKLLGLTKDENDIYLNILSEKDTTGVKKYNNAKFYLKNLLGNEEDYYTTTEGVKYRLYELYLIAEDREGKIVLLKPNEPTKPVQVSTIDQCVFATQEYSKYVPLVEKENIVNNYVQVPLL
ncbi:hypothetical protein C3729_13020 [Cloacibacterium normanense]|uniref:Uncharacterized protein n=1 Tax=Cloacibacterium normanense TaxID=237258 RepID=A0A2S7I1T6_9FLAO|nr:hypothetical protein [Cloacibacterium normanense]PPZ90479.1 hypothetical protein C3729_13020 [Cloacibacterium normanense]